MSDDTILLDESDVSNRLGLSVKTLQKWRYEGTPEGVELPHVKLGENGAVRYRLSDVKALIEANIYNSTSAADVAFREDEPAAE